MRADLPSGTVTFLFTDIEGSTRLLHALGPDAYAEALAVHRSLLRSAFARQGGVEVDTQGDAFFVAFLTAPDAAAAALAGQRALSVGPIRVRMGLHTGAPTVTEEGYVGVDVHRGARVAALAHGGQVLLSATTAGLLDAADLSDLGAHRLKDFDSAIRLYQLGAEKHPPLRTPGTVLLPTPATPFLGRERELLEAVSVVLGRDPRVFTIVGPGGTGKTRFALELARLLSEEAEGGSVFVPLAALRDPSLVLATLAEAVGAEETSPESIAVRVGGKRTHVLLDNLEQLLPDVAREIALVVEASPALRLLLTSREPLRIAAETEFDLPPLAPDEAVSLFLATAERVHAIISHTATVDRLCERLDRLPLALELAAARTKLLSPEALLERLGACLDLLRGGRDADPRHATLAATISWSYDLLDPDEQQLFRRLAVFRGGCTLESAEAVCEADVDSLSSLLDKSLLRRRSDPDETDRYWMLETIREFAMARLAETDDEDLLRRRQHGALLELTRRANTEEGIEGGRPGRWHLDLVAPELDNIRSLLDWAVDCAPEHGLELMTALEAFWVVREPVEGALRFERLLQAAPEAPAQLRAGSLRAL
ncbi:MAG: adenylate/guanylate cyclase domain-containing protein, partial [Actinobacteria bacterium]|nr:adenylate/guanylate cyclase domain-containing protein [Actinomycetota bacterium]